MQDYSAQTVILANGAFPGLPELTEMLKHAERIVCCDGAVRNLLDFGREPDFIVGDMDSIAPELKVRFASRIIHEREQETNDLSKAFRFCMAHGWRNLLILGAGGRREDHLLGNLALLPSFASAGASVSMQTDYGTAIPVLHSGTFHAPLSRKVSIFSFNPEMAITSTGLKYPLNHLKLPYWWCGTLNETLSDTFTLDFDESAPLILYFPR